MVHLTEVLELPVYDSRGKKIGRVAELAANPTAEPPRVTPVLVKEGKNAPLPSLLVGEGAFFRADRGLPGRSHRSGRRAEEGEIDLQPFHPYESAEGVL